MSNRSNYDAQGHRFSLFRSLRESLITRIINEILGDLFWVVFWILLNLDLISINVQTLYSKREQEWCSHVMTTFSIMMAGFCVHKAFMIGTASNTRRHRILVTSFLVFLCLIGGFQLRLFVVGLSLNSDLPNTGTPNG